MTDTHIWLRAETKPNEERTPLTPAGASLLLDKGFRVTVEQDRDRVFPLAEYSAAGCETADSGAWIDAQLEVFIGQFLQPEYEGVARGVDPGAAVGCLTARG